MQGVEGHDAPALRAADQLLDAAALVHDQAEAFGDGAAQAVRPGIAGRIPPCLGEPHAVGLAPAAVLRGDGDGDLAEVLERYLVAVRLVVGVIGGSIATPVRRCIASASTVVSVTPSATTAS